MELFPGSNYVPFAVELFENITGFQVVVPETIGLAQPLESGNLRLEVIDVKDTPAASPGVLLNHRNLYQPD